MLEIKLDPTDYSKSSAHATFFRFPLKEPVWDLFQSIDKSGWYYWSERKGRYLGGFETEEECRQASLNRPSYE